MRVEVVMRVCPRGGAAPVGVDGIAGGEEAGVPLRGGSGLSERQGQIIVQEAHVISKAIHQENTVAPPSPQA